VYNGVVVALCADRGKNTMKFRPLHDPVVIRRAEVDVESKGGIVIIENAREKSREGEVVATGPGIRGESGKQIPLGVRVGDIFLFEKWSGTKVRIDGDDLLIVKEADTADTMDIVQKTAATRKAA
jgi:chaperonin GroES